MGLQACPCHIKHNDLNNIVSRLQSCPGTVVTETSCQGKNRSLDTFKARQVAPRKKVVTTEPRQVVTAEFCCLDTFIRDKPENETTARLSNTVTFAAYGVLSYFINIECGIYN